MLASINENSCPRLRLPLLPTTCSNQLASRAPTLQHFYYFFRRKERERIATDRNTKQQGEFSSAVRRRPSERQRGGLFESLSPFPSSGSPLNYNLSVLFLNSQQLFFPCFSQIEPSSTRGPSKSQAKKFLTEGQGPKERIRVS